MSDFLVKFYCVINGVEEGYSQEKIKNLYSTQTNGKINPVNILIPNSLDSKDFPQYTGNILEINIELIKHYIFLYKKQNIMKED